jgi:hypothetical protein
MEQAKRQSSKIRILSFFHNQHTNSDRKGTINGKNLALSIGKANAEIQDLTFFCKKLYGRFPLDSEFQISEYSELFFVRELPNGFDL